MKKMLIRLVQDDQGQDLVEYAMLVSLVALFCVTGVTLFGGAVNAFFEGIAGEVPLIGAP